MRCGYCYKQGHNRRTCPDLTKRMKDRADAAIARGEPDHFFVHVGDPRRPNHEPIYPRLGAVTAIRFVPLIIHKLYVRQASTIVVRDALTVFIVDER